jgi:hypothetical protein
MISFTRIHIKIFDSIRINKKRTKYALVTLVGTPASATDKEDKFLCKVNKQKFFLLQYLRGGEAVNVIRGKNRTRE